MYSATGSFATHFPATFHQMLRYVINCSKRDSQVSDFNEHFATIDTNGLSNYPMLVAQFHKPKTWEWRK